MPPQVPDGTITVFVLPVSPRKVEVYVNGLRQAQQSEVLAGTRFDFAWAGNTITFQPGVAIPLAGDTVLVMATL